MINKYLMFTIALGVLILVPSMVVGDDSKSYGLGSDEANIEMIMYASMSDPFTQNHMLNVHKDIVDNYVNEGKVRLLYKHFIRNDEDMRAALGAECAGDQNPELFFQYIYYFYSYSDILDGDEYISDDRLRYYAEISGANMAEWDSCVDNQEFSERINAQTQEAKDKGYRGTPTFDITDSPRIKGAVNFEAFEYAFDNVEDDRGDVPSETISGVRWSCDIDSFSCPNQRLKLVDDRFDSIQFRFQNNKGYTIDSLDVSRLSVNPIDLSGSHVFLDRCEATKSDRQINIQNSVRNGEYFYVDCDLEHNSMDYRPADVEFKVTLRYSPQGSSQTTTTVVELFKDNLGETITDDPIQVEDPDDPGIDDEPITTIRLEEGWNLFSIPFIDNQNYIRTSCNSDIEDYIFAWDGSEYVNNPSGSDTYEGYWVRSDSSCTISYGDELRHNSMRTLNPGWNIISSNNDRNDLSILNDCDVRAGPFGFDAKRNEYDPVSVLDDTKGYWVNVADSCTIGSLLPPEPPRNV